MTDSSIPTFSQPTAITARKTEKRGRHYRPGTYPLVSPLDTVLPTTIGELPSHTFQVKPEIEAVQIVREMEHDPELPGVLIVKEYECLGMVSRQKCFERLGRPFGVEVFLNRPIITLQESIEHELTILPANTRISVAVQIALTRPLEHRYEPIIVQRTDQRFQLLDLPVLLLAQSNLLTHANRLVKYQVETGRALTGTLEPFQVLKLILERLKVIVPFNRGGLLLETAPWLEYVAHDGFPAHIPHHQLRTHTRGNDVYVHLCQTRQPVLVPDVGSGVRWRYLFDHFPTTRTWLAVPLLRSNNVIGMLFLAHVFANVPYTHDDLEIAETFAAQASVALQNVRLAADQHAVEMRQKNLSRFRLPAWGGLQRELQEALTNLSEISQAMLDIPCDALTEPLRQKFMALQAIGQRLRALLEQTGTTAPEETHPTPIDL